MGSVSRIAEDHVQPDTGVSGANILVVEDDHIVALDIQTRLTRMGHYVVVAYSGEAAVREATETGFDLILMDIKLGGAIDGIEATNQIHATRDVPVIYLTAYADNTTLERARASEPYGYVLKPFQERELRATIDMALRRHESDRERWELYLRAERAVQMRDDVLAIVSHDLRTPLAKILMQAEAVAEHPDLRETGQSIARSIDRMNRLINDLLDASAINAGQLSLDIGKHSISKVVHEAVELFRPTARAKAIKLRERLPDDSVCVYCDRDRILQVISNLVGNAIKFTPAGGMITVTVDATEADVRIEVSDTGSGIAPENVPHLFDRFWRGHARGKGSGLGLFIARGIVVAHGSTLEVETAVDLGTRFYFTLPTAT